MCIWNSRLFYVICSLIPNATVGYQQVQIMWQLSIFDVDMKPYSKNFHPTATCLLPKIIRFFLDCASTNFVTETYFFIRRMRMDVSLNAFRLYYWYSHCSPAVDSTLKLDSRAVKVIPLFMTCSYVRCETYIGTHMKILIQVDCIVWSWVGMCTDIRLQPPIWN